MGETETAQSRHRGEGSWGDIIVPDTHKHDKGMKVRWFQSQKPAGLLSPPTPYPLPVTLHRQGQALFWPGPAV